MKTIVKAVLFSAATLFAAQGMAGTIKSDTTKVGRTTRKVEHQVSNTAANADSRVVDRKYHEKRGPHGETVYITRHDRYYYINKKGHRVYVTKSQLRDEKED
ncbi:MAG TPA: hypothetical protein VHS53_13085 [Mucilaginibacter sp.]|jgi:hypothetical protein|nr:hypothetical protein [Mucilaginibacter sp.]HWD87184.1 hypothetical protein [Mucilaginibacter sp.]